MNDTVLHAAARQAYERGRIRSGVRRALAVLPVSCVPLYFCLSAGRAALMLALVATLGTLLVTFHWRGEEYARGAKVGAIAGLSPLLLPVLTGWLAPLLSSTVCELLPGAAVAGGFLGALGLAGGGLTHSRGDLPSDRPGIPFWFAAITVTVTLGAAGCLHVGLAGLGGLALGLTAGTVPLLAMQAFRTR